MDQSAEAEETIEALRKRLAEAEETLHAIRSGAVDAVVVDAPHGPRVYTLKGADEPYRMLVERMQEGAVTLRENGVVLFANGSFAEMVGAPLRAGDRRGRSIGSCRSLSGRALRPCSRRRALPACARSSPCSAWTAPSWHASSRWDRCRWTRMCS